MKKLSFLALFANLCLAVFFGAGTAFVVGGAPLAFASGIFAIGTGSQLIFQNVQSISGIFTMALQTEIWVADIQEQLFAGNEFLNFAVDHSQYVNNKKVHVPNSGSLVAVTKDRSTLPATIAQRTDGDLEYTLSEFTTDPVLITDLEEIQTAYDKRQSVTGQQFALLSERVALEIMYNWAVEGTKVLRTTGATTGLLPNATATGTRKKLTKEDLALLATRMDQDKVPADGRYIMLDSIMFNDLFTVSEIMSMEYMAGSASQPDGTIAKLFGFNIMKRAGVVTYTAAVGNVRKAVGAAEAATDCAGSIAWSKYSVGRAIGDIKIFADEDKPEYYGSVLSSMVLAGGKILRSDNAGVWAIAQGS